MTPLRVLIIGATGRMGRALMRLAAGDAEFRVVGAIVPAGDPALGSDAGAASGVGTLGVELTSTFDAAADVAVEFTLPAGCAQWAEWCGRHGVALVSGTTGLGEGQLATLRAAATRVPVVRSPNMSVGVNVLLDVVQRVAAALGSDWDVEICEAHHRRKVDAPSGTAQALLAAVCAARGQRPEDVAVHGRHGQCDPRAPAEIGMHALRLGALVGDHEVHFASESETITLGHRALSRDTFAAGALRAARWVHGRAPGLYDMQAVLAAG